MLVTHALSLCALFSISIADSDTILPLLTGLHSCIMCSSGKTTVGIRNLTCAMPCCIISILGLISVDLIQLVLFVGFYLIDFSIIIKTRILSFEALSLVFLS